MEDRINAGEFANWINEFIRTMKGDGDGDVPCGDCVACCTSSKFIHIRPTDLATIKNIPKEIMFQAPGLPNGHYLLGYDEKGHCPMFNGGKCSIYEFRPETCRQYDCRVLAAAEVPISEESYEITERVKSWEFECSTPESVEFSNAVKLAGMFLLKYGSHFPGGVVPASGSQVAVLAVRIHKEFIGQTALSVEENYNGMVNTLVSKYLS